MDHVIFDLDGCLVDTEHLHRHALSVTLNRHIDLELFHNQFQGVTTRQILRHYGVPEQAHERMIIRKRHLFNQMSQDLRLPPQSRAVLQAVKARGHQLALCSNNNLDSVFAILGCDAPLFDVIVSKDQTAEPKPHPAPYLLCLEQLGSPDPRDVVVFEDAPSGIQAARAAGIQRVIPLTVEHMCVDNVLKHLEASC